MQTHTDSILSTELQELYLQNKDWLSQLLFLDDECRFFQKLFVQRRFYIGETQSEKDIALISESLIGLEKRTNNLRNLVLQHQHLLEHIMKDVAQHIDMAMIEEYASITQQIQELLYLDRLLKSELFAMVEGQDR